MSSSTANTREPRTNFRPVKRRMQEHGEVMTTEGGEPASLRKPLSPRHKKSASVPDYYARLLKRQPRPLSAEAIREFWEEEPQ